MGEERDEVTEPIWTWDGSEVRTGYLDVKPGRFWDVKKSREIKTLDFPNATLVLDFDGEENLIGIEVLK